jgi:hypothetical protein
VKNKPILEMTEKEREKCWDECGASNRHQMLDEARQGKLLTKVAILLLVLPSGVKEPLHYAPEYGDEEGLNHMKDFAAEIRRTRSLLPGEKLEILISELAKEDFQ